MKIMDDDIQQRFVLIDPEDIDIDNIEYHIGFFVIPFKELAYPASYGLPQKCQVFYTKRNTKDLREQDIKKFFDNGETFYIHIVDTEYGSKCYPVNEYLRRENLEKSKKQKAAKKEDLNKFLDDIYGNL